MSTLATVGPAAANEPRLYLSGCELLLRVCVALNNLGDQRSIHLLKAGGISEPNPDDTH